MKVENYIIQEFNVFNNTTVIIFNNTKISVKNITRTLLNVQMCSDCCIWQVCKTLSLKDLVSMKLDNICTQNAGEKLNEQMASLSHIEEL